MALDFYQQNNKEPFFALEDKQFQDLAGIFNEFQCRTGLVIDQFSDAKLTIENQATIIKIIDDYIKKADLNKNKLKTVTIIEFRTHLKYSHKKKNDLLLKGD
ncbi:hypothetical protein [Adhaeribacter pallidiroseus]|uniref:Uncharacterized protein n=1 Tax=Adhaeribacter pallidiroseus TaxID=2072847 RepID=A0A369QKE8_9BACT|nr:hypothetical protein [Adhaeribacter pallidiroseus]RDC65393.1 hypothetical protein AHMF7616_04023 [Adhaeribacter pallidiroseus]